MFDQSRSSGERRTRKPLPNDFIHTGTYYRSVDRLFAVHPRRSCGNWNGPSGEIISSQVYLKADNSMIQIFQKPDLQVGKRLRKLIKKCGLPSQWPDLDSQEIIECLYHDMNHKIKFILVKELGSVEIVEDMPEADILKMLQS